MSETMTSAPALPSLATVGQHTEPRIEHSDPPALPENLERFNVECPECHDVMLSTSLGSHRKTVHGKTIRHDRTYLEKFRTELPISVARGRRPRAAAPGKPAVGREPKPVKGQPLPFMETVLAALYPKGIPVRDFDAVTRWVTASKEFLGEISGE